MAYKCYFPLRKAIWSSIWRHTAKKSRTNATSRRGDLKKHLKKHSGEKSYKCNQCDYASSRKGDWKKHLEKHSGGKTKKCNQCDYTCTRAGTLMMHLKMHSGEQSEKCNQCEYTCSNPSSLRAHLKIHSGENQTNATNVIQEFTYTSALGVEKNETKAINVIIHQVKQAIWGHM